MSCLGTACQLGTWSCFGMAQANSEHNVFTSVRGAMSEHNRTWLSMSDFVWLIKSTGYDMVNIASVAEEYYKGNLLFYIEFNNIDSRLAFEKYIPLGILKSESGSLLVAMDITAGDHIVTLTGVKAYISDHALNVMMSEYGDVRAVYRGFHSTEIKEIDNGKRYVTFSGVGRKLIPTSISVHGVALHVKYNGQYIGKSKAVSAAEDRDITELSHREHTLKVNQCTQTEKQPKNTRNQQTEAKPSSRHFSSMVRGVSVQNRATNTEHPEFVDVAVQRNFHIKRKGTQTEDVETKDENTQCRVSSDSKSVQTSTLADDVKEYRQTLKRGADITRKRKRILSGHLRGQKDIKSIKLNSHTIYKYFQSKKPKLLECQTLTTKPKSQTSRLIHPTHFSFSLECQWTRLVQYVVGN